MMTDREMDLAVGTWFRARRKDLGMTLRDMTDRMWENGNRKVHISALGDLELGRKPFTLRRWRDLAAGLDMNVGDLIREVADRIDALLQ